MADHGRWLFTVLLFSVLVSCEAPRSSTPSSEAGEATLARLVKVGEGSLWRKAVERRMPKYPAESLEKGRGGVTVAQVVVAVDGSVEQISVLEAPDAAIADSAALALSEWTFRPTTVMSTGEVRRMQGKIVLYFHPEEGGRVVGLQELDGARVEASQDRIATVEEVDAATLKMMLEAPEGRGWIVLDVRPRDLVGEGNAINIPFDEIRGRAAAELDERSQVVVDCVNFEEPLCRRAAADLALFVTRVALHIPK